MSEEELKAIVNNPLANTASPYYKDAVDMLLRMKVNERLQTRKQTSDE